MTKKKIFVNHIPKNSHSRLYCCSIFNKQSSCLTISLWTLHWWQRWDDWLSPQIRTPCSCALGEDFAHWLRRYEAYVRAVEMPRTSTVRRYCQRKTMQLYTHLTFWDSLWETRLITRSWWSCFVRDLVRLQASRNCAGSWTIEHKRLEKLWMLLQTLYYI